MPVPVKFISTILNHHQSAVICGSRSAIPAVLPHFLHLCKAANLHVHTGCCAGVPAATRAAFGGSPAIPPRCRQPRIINPAHSLSVWVAGTCPRPAVALAKRSQAMVKAAAASGALWCSFPASAQPAAARPCRSWLPLHSGTWSSLCLAAGHGCPCLVYRPGWSPFPPFVHLQFGWFFLPNNNLQISFF